MCWDEASALSLLTRSVTPCCAPSRSPTHPSSPSMEGEASWAPWQSEGWGGLEPGSLPSPLSSTAGGLTSATGAQYLQSVQDEGTRAKRSRAQPWMFVSKVQMLPKQVRFMLLAVGQNQIVHLSLIPQAAKSRFSAGKF